MQKYSRNGWQLAKYFDVHELFHCFRHSQSSIYAVHLRYPSSTLICGPFWPLNSQNHNFLSAWFNNLKTSGKLKSLNSVYAVVRAHPCRKGCVKEIPATLWMNNPVLCKQIMQCFVQVSLLFTQMCTYMWTCAHMHTYKYTVKSNGLFRVLTGSNIQRYTWVHWVIYPEEKKKTLHKNVTKVFLTELISGAQR